MVYLARHVLPEVVVLFLRREGNAEALDALDLSSPQGLTNLKFSWRIAKLWEVPARDLLAAGDIGLVPWVPLTKFKGPPSRSSASVGHASIRSHHVTSTKTCWP